MNVKWKDKLIRELTDYGERIRDFITKYHDPSFLSVCASAREAEREDFKRFEEKMVALFDALKEEIRKAEDPKIKGKLKDKLDCLHENIGFVHADRNITDYAPKDFFNSYVEDYLHLGLGVTNVTIPNGYPNLVLFLILSGIYPVLLKNIDEKDERFLLLWCVYGNICKPRGTYTKYFYDKYSEVLEIALAKRITFKGIDDAPRFYSRDAAPFEAGKGEEGELWVSGEEECPLLFLDEKGVQEIVSFLNKKAYTSIIDAVIAFREQINAPSMQELEDLKELCELSADEIVIYDNRYYAEKQLEQQQEVERQRQEDERRRLEQEQAQWEEEQRMQAAEARRQRLQAEETNRLLAESNRMQAQQAREEQRRHQEQIAAQKKQAVAVIDARLAELKKELFNLHGPTDTPRRLAVQREIDELEFKKNHL